MIEIIDGIIDQHKYNASKYKILWILKEGNVSEEDKAKNVAINLCTVLVLNIIGKMPYPFQPLEK